MDELLNEKNTSHHVYYVEVFYDDWHDLYRAFMVRLDAINACREAEVGHPCSPNQCCSYCLIIFFLLFFF